MVREDAFPAAKDSHGAGREDKCQPRRIAAPGPSYEPEPRGLTAAVRIDDVPDGPDAGFRALQSKPGFFDEPGAVNHRFMITSDP